MASAKYCPHGPCPCYAKSKEMGIFDAREIDGRFEVGFYSVKGEWLAEKISGSESDARSAASALNSPQGCRETIHPEALTDVLMREKGFSLIQGFYYGNEHAHIHKSGGGYIIWNLKDMRYCHLQRTVDPVAGGIKLHYDGSVPPPLFEWLMLYDGGPLERPADQPSMAPWQDVIIEKMRRDGVKDYFSVKNKPAKKSA